MVNAWIGCLGFTYSARYINRFVRTETMIIGNVAVRNIQIIDLDGVVVSKTIVDVIILADKKKTTAIDRKIICPRRLIFSFAQNVPGTTECAGLAMKPVLSAEGVVILMNMHPVLDQN